jgi:hypothetical protein
MRTDARFLLLQAALAAIVCAQSETYAIQYFCCIGGGISPNSAQASSGCRDSEFVESEWLGEFFVGSIQNGTKVADTNPWDFSMRTFGDLIGSGNLEVWDWSFSSAGPLSYEPGGEQILDLTKNTSVAKGDFGGVPGFTATGDQTGYLGHTSEAPSARLELGSTQCGTPPEPGPAKITWCHILVRNACGLC